MTLKNGMQNPGTFYVPVQSWMYNYTYFNLWDADNTDVSSNRSNNDGPTIKTVYDPSPAGFKVPATNAFTGFTTTGGNVESLNQINTSQTYNSSGLMIFNHVSFKPLLDTWRCTGSAVRPVAE